MDSSKLKLEAYDLLGLILPGLIAVCEAWIFLRGWQAFLLAAAQITGTTLTLLLLASFATGNAVQELGDLVVNLTKGKRYLRRARDRFWASSEADFAKKAIKAELGHPVTSVDAAFDHCLTKVEGRFAKRDIFLATSDLCRSLVVLAFLAIVPASRVLANAQPRPWLAFAAFVILALTFSLLMWRRMVRFRELSDITVFRIYLAAEAKSETKT